MSSNDPLAILNEQSNFIIGKVAAIFFQNPTNYYKVILVKLTETDTEYKDKEIVVTGNFGTIQEEEIYRFLGKIVEHPKYGQQFQATTYQQEQPTSKNGLIAYLSSDKFPGIGKKTAERIIETLGENAIDEVVENPTLLEQVPNLNDKKQKLIIETLRLNHGMEKTIVGLNQLGFSSQIAFQIFQEYRHEALNIIEENPYKLVEDIDGIGFKKADNLAEQIGIAYDSPKRIQSAILMEVLHQCLNTGDTYVEAEDLLKKTITMLETSRPFEIAPDLVANEMIELTNQGKIVQENTQLYDKSLYFSEWGIATSIQRLLAQKQAIHYSEKKLDKTLALLEEKLEINYGKSQLEAIKAAITSPLFVLTGGPGTGKTTVINGIVSLFAELNGLSLDPNEYHDQLFPILLAAPTGRAAKRLNETTGLPASTIHRLLGLTGREKNPEVVAKELEGGLLVIDEMSMVDTWLANTLFKSIPTNMQVIIVGDKDQLPSVGPGQVLHDLLQINELPKKELIEIYRQEDGSTIIELAHDLKQGYLPTNFIKNQRDRSFFNCDASQIEPVIKQIVTKAQAKGFTPQDIQVLAPMYRGVAGIDALNQMMQEIFNPNDHGKRKEVQWNQRVYRIGDKVLHLVNSPEINVFNGDMGVITGIVLAKDSEDKIDQLIIEFDSGEITYSRNEWYKITMAYCCSIHKAQGSEFKMVILPMVHQYRRMLQRNLLYTAVTRSREILILLGEPSAFQMCVENQSVNRKTTLIQRIVSADNLTPAELSNIEAYEKNWNQETTENPWKSVDQNKDKEDYEKKTSEKNDSSIKHSVTVPKKVTISKTTELPSSEMTISLFDPPNPTYITNSENKAETPVNTPINPVTPILTQELIQSNKIDPMIGMEGITPIEFLIK